MVGIEPRRIQPRDLNENTNPVATNPRLTTQSNLVILATHFFILEITVNLGNRKIDMTVV